MYIALYYGALMAGLSAMLIAGGGYIALVVYYIGMPLGALALWRSDGHHWSQLNYAAFRTIWPLGVLGSTVAAGLVASIAGLLLAAEWATRQPISQTWWVYLAGLCAQQALVAGLEELAFRGVLQQMLAVRTGIWPALGLTAVLFGAFHIPNSIAHDVAASRFPILLANLALMGLVFGAAFEWTGRALLIPTGLHFGWNVAAYGFEEQLIMSPHAPHLLTGSAAWFPETGLLATAALALLAGIAWCLRPRHALRTPPQLSAPPPSA